MLQPDFKITADLGTGVERVLAGAAAVPRGEGKAWGGMGEVEGIAQHHQHPVSIRMCRRELAVHPSGCPPGWQPSAMQPCLPASPCLEQAGPLLQSHGA